MNPRRLLMYRLFQYVWRFKLTRAGKYLVGCGFVLGVLTSPSLYAPVYGIFSMLFITGLLALIVNFLYRPRLRLSGALPGKAVAGQDLGGTIAVRNGSRFPAWDLSAGFLGLPKGLVETTEPCAAASVPSGGTATLEVGLRALKRGIYPLPPVRVFTTFPFDLLRSGSARLPSGPLVVLPAFTPLEGIDVPVSRRHQPGGIALTSHIGESPEYIGNREYQPGDAVRRIDARAWARLGRPVVREFQEEYFCRIALVVDTFVPRGRRAEPKGFPGLEAAVSLAAAITDALGRGEYILDVFAAGPELYVFRSGRRTSSFDNVLEILAGVDACRANPFDKVAPALADELDNISTVIFVLLDWDASRRTLARIAAERGCSIKTVIIRDGATSEPVEPDDTGAPAVYAPAAILSGQVTSL